MYSPSPARGCTQPAHQGKAQRSRAFLLPPPASLCLSDSENGITKSALPALRLTLRLFRSDLRVVCRFKGLPMQWDRGALAVFVMSLMPWYTLQPPPPPPPSKESLMNVLKGGK